jgi:hydrogenase maturation protein HypF
MPARTAAPALEASPDRLRRRLVVRGVVQGVGFRPFVYVSAAELSLSGSVANDSSGVVIEIEGSPADMDEFARRLVERPPPLAMVESVEVSALPVRGGTGFRIAESSNVGGTRTLASPDVATCADCIRELTDPADRRYRHPFITCTNCGPRFTIMTDLPYDRPATTMAGFDMCAACEAEYSDPADRRFHAQPIACPRCGPRLELVRREAGAGAGPARLGADALDEARRLLMAGAIVAVKGLGGYHLACDAGNDGAVARLRRRKRRGDKPFAVMARDLDTARQLVHIDRAEQTMLSGLRRPIVLLARRDGPRAARTARRVSDAVAPGNPDLGVMLPYTPIHTLLFGLDGDDPSLDVLVMTSGNLAGEPIAYDDDDARRRLDQLADAWLRHDRPICVPCDDSVSRVVDGEELPIRRSRGYAPLPIALPAEVPATLAVGADLKNTCCLAQGGYAWLSQHIGDMDDLATLEAFTSTEQHLERLTGVAPVMLVADRHPGYRSAGWARAHSETRPVRTVQHHHAHVAAVMAEHGLDGSERVIGISFDGTGYGDDGAVWGGEVLLADYKGFRRFAHLGYVWLPGGDAAVQRPYRMALAHLAAAGIGWDEDLPSVDACPAPERDVLAHQLATGFGCVATSSAGRLFDAVASLAGVRHVVDYEAQAAIELEALARQAEVTPGWYPLPLGRRGDDGDPLVADPAPLIRAVVADVRAGAAPGTVGRRFHATLVEFAREVAATARASAGLETVALTGGVFQNALLLSATRRALRADGFAVLCHRQVPPNDGGLALGQVLVGTRG